MLLGGGTGARRRSNCLGSKVSWLFCAVLCFVAGRAGAVDRISRLPSQSYAKLDTLRLNLAFLLSGREGYLSGPTSSLGISKGPFWSLPMALAPSPWGQRC